MLSNKGEGKCLFLISVVRCLLFVHRIELGRSLGHGRNILLLWIPLLPLWLLLLRLLCPLLWLLRPLLLLPVVFHALLLLVGDEELAQSNEDYNYHQCCKGCYSQYPEEEQ